MPARLEKRNLVARPDRADFRDRKYLPPLRSLPEQYPSPALIKDFLGLYVQHGNILDQGKEGACTGFGLAACVNYVYWSRWMSESNGKADASQRPPLVSPHMLYRNARVYDEWEGEDYEGSSCRGAMKGWYKHGVCVGSLWDSSKRRPDASWAHDAAKRPLGAYYRVDAKSVADMQAAIYEVKAVYCSADVHTGWDKPDLIVDVAGTELAVIRPGGKLDGGHAFALVGYTREGFIVQNSWNTDWGTYGFALLTYEDWIKNGNDAWVSALGAPMAIGIDKGAPSAGRNTNLMAELTAATVRKSKSAGVAIWEESKAYDHAIVMGNDGKLIQRLVHANDADDALAIVAEENVVRDARERIAIYVHGGLNDEASAVKRIRRMGPWFEANGIHPLFVVWRTGIMEAIGQIGLDEVKEFEEVVKNIRAKGLGDIVANAIETARDAFDRAFEVTAEKLIGKAVWSQMKQNAAMAAKPDAGIGKLVKLLAQHKQPIHLLGHSAGSIMIGHMLDAAKEVAPAMKFKSCGLYAPACTMAFAVEKFGGAMDKGALKGGSLKIDLMKDSAETDDSVGPYGKSLLYLVSRALEDVHKMPILGLEIAHEKEGKGKKMTLNEAEQKNAFNGWSALKARQGDSILVVEHSGPKVKTSSKQTIPIAHGSFDNDIKVVGATLTTILGKEPDPPVTDLTGF